MKILRFSLDLMKNEGKARHSQHHGVEIITPETLKQLILKTAVHENILAGPLRDAYGTAVDWFYMTRDFRETSACSTITICAKYNTYE